MTVILLTAGTTWIVPSDFNPSNNRVACIGAGGGGGAAEPGGGGAGGGGAYAHVDNIVLQRGDTINIAIGAGGTGSGQSGTAGGPTWFGGSSFETATVAARGGGGAALNISGTGGQASTSIGTVRSSGGTSSPGDPANGQGGGGAGGPDGDGIGGSLGNGGDADAGNGGAGGLLG